MIKINEVVIVEGKYDKIKLSSIIDATIITTDGFGIFRDKEKQKLIKRLADERGILVLTDSDNAGFVIRGFLKGIVDNQKIRHAYIPDLYGKEKRKTQASAEGKLGVEGVKAQIIEESLRKAGVECQKNENKNSIKKSDLYSDGFYGVDNCNEKRLKLLKRLDLPENMNANLLLEMINVFLTYDEYKQIVKELEE